MRSDTQKARWKSPGFLSCATIQFLYFIGQRGRGGVLASNYHRTRSRTRPRH